MDSRVDELRLWLLNDISRGDPDCDIKIREIISTDKNLVRNINALFKDNKKYEIKKTIEKHLNENRIIVRTCKECKKINVVSSDDLYEKKCSSCNNALVNRKPRESSHHIVKNTTKKREEKNCIHCGAPVAPFSKMVCMECYRDNSQFSIRFS